MRAFLVAVVLFFAQSATAGERICGRSVSGTIEILVTTALAGVTEGFRLTEDGLLSRAQWTRNHRLVGLSGPVLVGPQAFESASQTLQHVTPTGQNFDSTDTPVLPQPTGLAIEIAQHRPRQPTRALTRNLPDDRVDALLEEWKARTALRTPAPGTYVWAIRAPVVNWRPDLDLSRWTCGDTTASAVAGTLTGPSVVIGVGDELSDFLANGQSRRPRFIARSRYGFANFGVLYAE